MSQRLDDGHSTLIEFSLAPNVKFWEKTVTPPGMDGGGVNDTTTMHNERWRTNSPKKLLTLTQMSANCAYDPAVLDDITSMMQVNQEITVRFPDGSQWKFWGWLDSFQPGENSEGEQPTADVTVQCSNTNEAKEEVAPEYIEAETDTGTPP